MTSFNINNRQIGEHQAKARLATKPKGVTHRATMTKSKTLARKIVSVELDVVWHDAGDLSLMGRDCNPTRERRVPEIHMEDLMLQSARASRTFYAADENEYCGLR